MDFSLVKRNGIPDDLMEKYYDRGRDAGDFGTTEDRAESDQYDTLALVSEGEVAGTADLFFTKAEAILGGCYILPEYREKLEENKKSAFEHMAAARIENTDLPVRTSATMKHGKTQHIYEKFDFMPYEYELPRSDHNAPHIVVADQHKNRKFDSEIFIPDSLRDFVTYVSESFNQEPKFREGEYQGVEVSYIENAFDDGYDFFKVREGAQELQPIMEWINENKNEGTNITVEVDPQIPSAYEVLDVLEQEGFRATGYKPLIEGEIRNSGPDIIMAYSNEPVEASLTPQTKEFLDESGWETEIMEEGELSDEIIIR